jgi:Domain of unknown function (DUF305)
MSALALIRAKVMGTMFCRAAFKPRLGRQCAAAALVVLVAVVCGPGQAGDPTSQFKAENDAAMEKMMAGMAIKPSGDVDRDFAEMMISHHQGAIDMAEVELRHGSNEQLRRIAQEIIVDQQQEIVAMRLALGDPLPATPAAMHPGSGSAPAASKHAKPKDAEPHQ